MARSRESRQKTALYRLYDSHDDLLYVGTTTSLPARLAEHSRRDWFPQVSRTTVEWYSSPEAAREAEREEIRGSRAARAATVVDEALARIPAPGVVGG